MTFEETLAWVKKEVEKELETFFEKKQKAASRIDPHCVELVDQVADVTMRGGKRIRAYLVWLGHEVARSEKREARRNIKRGNKENLYELVMTPQSLKDAMVALELFHSFALIHDDIMDEDKERRGGLTIHEYFRRATVDSGNPSDSRNQIKSVHFGTSMAIMAGDLALVWADETMSSVKYQVSGVKSKTSKKATRGVRDPIALYHTMKEEVIYGQTLDVMQMHQMADVPQQKINELKTAWYSVIRPFQIGASLAGASTSTLKLLATFGLPVGLLFQLKDDVLDGTLRPSAFEKATQPLRTQAACSLIALNLSKEMQSQCEHLVRFVVERTF